MLYALSVAHTSPGLQLTGLNSEFSFSYTCFPIIYQELGQNRLIHTFPKNSKAMQTALFRFDLG